MIARRITIVPPIAPEALNFPNHDPRLLNLAIHPLSSSNLPAAKASLLTVPTQLLAESFEGCNQLVLVYTQLLTTTRTKRPLSSFVMADTKVLAAEPDPAATSLPNDQTVAEKLGGKAVEAAKEPVETPAEEISKVQAAKDEKAAGKRIAATTSKQFHSRSVDSKKVEAAEAVETDVKDKREKSSEHGEGARNNDHRKPNDKKSDRRNKPNNGRFTRTNHSKFDPSSLPVTDDPDEIRKQVRFFRAHIRGAS